MLRRGHAGVFEPSETSASKHTHLRCNLVLTPLGLSTDFEKNLLYMMMMMMMILANGSDHDLKAPLMDIS